MLFVLYWTLAKTNTLFDNQFLEKQNSKCKKYAKNEFSIFKNNKNA